MIVIRIGNYQFNAIVFDGLTQKEAVSLFEHIPAAIVKQAWKQSQATQKQ
jgi:hypothetical protein